MKDVKIFGPGCKRCQTTVEMAQTEAYLLGLTSYWRRSRTTRRSPAGSCDPSRPRRSATQHLIGASISATIEAR